MVWLKRGLIISRLISPGRRVLLEQVVPVPGDLEHDLRVDTSSSGSLLDGQAGFLEHVVALLLALVDGAHDLVRVERAGVRQHGQGELGGCHDLP